MREEERGALRTTSDAWMDILKITEEESHLHLAEVGAISHLDFMLFCSYNSSRILF